MTIMERYGTMGDARRAWRRVPVRVPVHCRRLARSETDITAETVDLSPGGVRLRCGGLITGDVVMCSVEGPSGELGLKGLVVQTRAAVGGAPFVHVAWTNLAPDAVEQLGKLLEQQEAAAGDG